MTDVVHRYHSPIFDNPKLKKLPPSFYWGVLFAVLLHLALLYCIFHQTFGMPLLGEPAPVDKPITMTMEPLQPPPLPEPTKTTTHNNPVVPHTPATATPDNIQTLPVDPVVNKTPTTSGPVTLPTVPATPGPVVSNEPVYVAARWSRFPTAEALTNYYPPRALNDEVEGAATVECTVLDANGRVRCTALSEIPGNYGFGKATVSMVQDKGRVDTSKGDIKIGSVLRQTVKWSLN
jgi:protein TonB